MQKGSLDFKNLSVSNLFFKQLFPTLLGMVSSALFTVIDGIFVGHGVGSDGIAAVNITVPLVMILTGIGLMFGMGGGVLASINTSRGKYKAANINVTQSTIAVVAVSTVLSVLIILFPRWFSSLLGADDYLMEYAVEYMVWMVVGFPATALMVSLLFFTRQTSPRFGMWSIVTATILNIGLDYLFIFIFRWGLTGAALATTIGEIVGAVLLLLYLSRKRVAVRFAKLKINAKSFHSMLCNQWSMIKLGASTCLSEITIAVMALSGNIVFMSYMGTDGVAAFSIICYLFPIIFMVFNSIVQSAQPIISYNYGDGNIARSNKALSLALWSAIIFGTFITLIFGVFSEGIISLFVPDETSKVFEYGKFGLPLFAIDYLFFGINVITIGYYASIERVKRSLGLTILRGVLPVVYFYIMPRFFGDTGVWISVAAGDLTTTLVIVALLIKDRLQKK